MEPTVITSLVSGALSGVTAAIRFAEIWMRLADAPEDARTFKRLVNQVRNDLEHALNCRVHLATSLKQQPKFYRDWIVGCIGSTMEALDHMGQFLQGDIIQASPLLDARVRHVLRNQPGLVSQERSLSYAHTSLLASINAMHHLMSQQEPSQAGAGQARPRLVKADSLRAGTLARASSTKPSHTVSRQPSARSTMTNHSSLSRDTVSDISSNSDASSVYTPPESVGIAELPCSPLTSNPPTPSQAPTDEGTRQAEFCLREFEDWRHAKGSVSP